MTTWYDASKCPACGFSGMSTAQKIMPSGSIIYTLRCSNTGCKERSIPWYVEKRKDGSIPEPSLFKNVEIDNQMIDPIGAQRIRDAIALNLDVGTHGTR